MNRIFNPDDGGKFQVVSILEALEYFCIQIFPNPLYKVKGNHICPIICDIQVIGQVKLKC